MDSGTRNRYRQGGLGLVNADGSDGQHRHQRDQACLAAQRGAQAQMEPRRDHHARDHGEGQRCALVGKGKQAPGQAHQRRLCRCGQQNRQQCRQRQGAGNGPAGCGGLCGRGDAGQGKRGGRDQDADDHADQQRAATACRFRCTDHAEQCCSDAQLGDRYHYRASGNVAHGLVLVAGQQRSQCILGHVVNRVAGTEQQRGGQQRQEGGLGRGAGAEQQAGAGGGAEPADQLQAQGEATLVVQAGEHGGQQQVEHAAVGQGDRQQLAGVGSRQSQPRVQVVAECQVHERPDQSAGEVAGGIEVPWRGLRVQRRVWEGLPEIRHRSTTPV